MNGDIPATATVTTTVSASSGASPDSLKPGSTSADSQSQGPNSGQTSAHLSPPEAESVHSHGHGHAGFWGLAVGAIGVVFGDIGTSPLYAFQAAMVQATKAPNVTSDSIIGVVSLALWALFLVVTVKYVIFVMRADNKGEGGVLSLMALAGRVVGRRTKLVFFLGVIGAALFYGDSIITPAISVLGAFQGLNDVKSLQGMIGPNTITFASFVILVGLFLIQSRGTATVAKLFGPVMVTWFVVIAVLGLLHVKDDPRIFLALSPHYAALYMIRHGMIGLLVLGSVFLTVTGAEALYADMGHFGRWPIQASWLFICLPALVLNYLGQGAYVLKALAIAQAHHQALGNQDWFFVMCPPVLRIGLVVLAVMASAIASQAVITGAYSMSQQAIQLGLLPRLDVRRTSETQQGQIFIPQINSMLMIGVLALVVIFRNSDNLADAYGLAVTGTMLVTTILAYQVARHMWNWSRPIAWLVIAPMACLDSVFLFANGLKIASGGWLPLTMGSILVALMVTWTKGTQILSEKSRRDSVSLTDLVEMLKKRPPHRVQGTAIFLTSDADVAPVALMHNLKHNKVLHEKNIILTVRTTGVPRVQESDRVSIEVLTDDFKKITLSYGFMESPNLPRAMGLCRKLGLKFDIMATSFFLGRRSVVPSANSGMPLWQDRLFIFLMKNATNPTEFFHIPPGRVVELGTQVTV